MGISYVPIETYWVPDRPYLESFSGNLWHSILKFANITSCGIQQAFKYVSSSLWPCLTVFKLKITNILKSSGWGLEMSELPKEGHFL